MMLSVCSLTEECSVCSRFRIDQFYLCLFDLLELFVIVNLREMQIVLLIGRLLLKTLKEVLLLLAQDGLLTETLS